MFELVAFAEVAAGNAGGIAVGGDAMSMLTSIGPLILLVAVFYFLILRPQKKREKAEKNMRESVKVGDSITTIGGISGKIVKIKEDSFVLETGMGAEKNKLLMKKWAIQTVDKQSAKNELNEEAEEIETTEE